MNECYQPIKGKIERIIDETPNIKTFVIRPQTPIKFLAGQFIELTLPGVGEAPFTPSSSPHVEDTLEITIMRAGVVTNLLHAATVGATVGIRGPFGKSYPMDKFFGKEIQLIGGGVGMAPLRSLLLALMAEVNKFKRVVLKYGAKTPADIVYKGQFKEWRKMKGLEISSCVDSAKLCDNWDDRVGVVTCLLEDSVKEKEDKSLTIAVVCGPPIMMKFATLKLLEQNHKPENIYLSMEKNMSCGLGKCGHCAVGQYFVCKDGPVFTYAQLKDHPELWT